jgi:RHS repeat-associated protein
MDGTNAYVYTTGIAPAEQINLTTGTVTYLTADRLGSVRGTVSSTGALTATTSYDAWGNPQTAGGLTADTPFGYAGAYTDPSGLVYLINRYYSPQTGQFISVDPDLASTMQPYVYAGDNPVSATDPSGLYRGVTYRPQPLPLKTNGSVDGWVNVVKMCTDNLKHCQMFWNTEFTNAMKRATGASLSYSIGVGGYTVFPSNGGSVNYPHTKNGNQVPLFHGRWGNKWGKTTLSANKWGMYQYGCGFLYLNTCTAYMNAQQGLGISGSGNLYLNGQEWSWWISNSWGRGKVQPTWKSEWIGCGLPY